MSATLRGTRCWEAMEHSLDARTLCRLADECANTWAEVSGIICEHIEMPRDSSLQILARCMSDGAQKRTP